MCVSAVREVGARDGVAAGVATAGVAVEVAVVGGSWIAGATGPAGPGGADALGNGAETTPGGVIGVVVPLGLAGLFAGARVAPWVGSIGCCGVGSVLVSVSLLRRLRGPAGVSALNFSMRSRMLLLLADFETVLFPGGTSRGFDPDITTVVCLLACTRADAVSSI